MSGEVCFLDTVKDWNMTDCDKSIKFWESNALKSYSLTLLLGLRGFVHNWVTLFFNSSNNQYSRVTMQWYFQLPQQHGKHCVQ